MRRRELLIFLSILTANVICSRVSIVGPLVSKGDTYKAYIEASGIDKNTEFVALLQCDTISVRKYFDSNELKANLGLMEFKLSRPYFGPCFFYSAVKKRNQCTSDEIFIETRSENIILVQTDKPVYRPKELVNFQVIALDAHTKPIEYENILVSIIDGSGHKVSSINTSDGIIKKFGFYEAEFTLAAEPNLGTWTIEVEIDGTKQNKTFRVDRFTLPAFKGFIETKPTVSFREKELNINVFAKYSFDKYVTGKATVITSLRSESNPHQVLSKSEKIVNINGGKNPIKINFKKDLKVNFVVRNFIMSIDVEFEEANTGIKAKNSRQLLLVPDSKFVICLKRAEKFRPGFPYKLSALVTTIDGNVVTDRSIPISLTIKYDSAKGEISMPAFPDMGAADFTLNVPEDAKIIELKAVYDDATFSEKISRVQTSQTDEFMQAELLTKNPGVGDTVRISVHSNAIMEALNVVVVGTTGIVYSKKFEETNDHDYEISFKLTQEMIPSADVIVFYLREQDGEMIYDHLKIDTLFSGENFMTLETPENALKYGQKASITASTKPSSLVALLAVDQSVTFMGEDNIISKALLDLKLVPSSKEYAYRLNKSHNAFGNINAFRLSPSSSLKKACSMFQQQLFENYNSEAFPRLEFDKETSPISIGGSNVRHNFPDVWFQEVKLASSGSVSFEKTLPDSITSWIVSGFSINPQHGLAVAEKKKVNVFQDFFIRIEKPYSIKLKEIANIKVIVHNYMSSQVQAMVSLDNTKNQFDFIEKQTRAPSSKSLSVLVKPGETGQVTFVIKPKVTGPIELNIVARANNINDEIKDTLLVDVQGVSRHDTRSVLINLKDNKTFHEDISFDVKNPIEDTVKFTAVTSYDLLGSVPQNIENLITLAEGCGEQKMRKFSTAIMAYRLLQETQQLADVKRLKNILSRSYQEVMALRNRDGSFNLWGGNNEVDLFNWLSNLEADYLDLTAYVVRLLSQYQEIEPRLDANVIHQAMKYIESQQQPTGSFVNDGKPQFRNLNQISKVDSVSLTAYVLIAILENKNLSAYYPNLVDKGLGFIEDKFNDVLDEGTNYEKALVLYLYILAEKDHSMLLEKLNENAKREGKNVYWNFDENPSPSAVQVEISSYVVLALLKLKEYEEALKVINFLISKTNPKGGFESTTDTVLGLQALAEASKILYAKETDMSVVLMDQFNDETELPINNQKRSITNDISLQPKNLSVYATGKGTANLQMSVQYKQEIRNFKEHFNINVVARKTAHHIINLKVCVNAIKGESNMALVEIEFPSGYTHRQGPSKLDEIKKIGFDKKGALILVYLEKVSERPICLNNIEGVQVAKVDSLMKSTVVVHDYYQPDKLGLALYNIN